jgi:hypothetical protein
LAEHGVHRQLATELAPRDGLRGLVLSASKELEPGARAMLLLADGLFRLDVAVSADSLRAIVRNLSSAVVEMRGGQGRAGGAVTSFGEVATNNPGRTQMGFTIGPAGDRLIVKVTLATLWFSERGTVRVSAQAIARQAASE